MIIEKICRNLILLTVLCLIGCNPEIPSFELKGDPAILKDMTINIRTTYKNKRENTQGPTQISYDIQTLIYKGKEYKLIFDEKKEILYYTIFYSYKNQVNILNIDIAIPKLMIKNWESQILSIQEKNDHIYIQYFGNIKEYIKNDALVMSPPTLPQNVFFNQINIRTQDEKKQYIDNFFQYKSLPNY